jgi:hypothetical protein
MTSITVSAPPLLLRNTHVPIQGPLSQARPAFCTPHFSLGQLQVFLNHRTSLFSALWEVYLWFRIHFLILMGFVQKTYTFSLPC